MTNVDGSSGTAVVVPAENFTGPFWFKVEYEIEVSEALMGWLKELSDEVQRAELLGEHLAARSTHINIVSADPTIDQDDELWEEVDAS